MEKLVAGKLSEKQWTFNFSHSALEAGGCEVAFWFRYVRGIKSEGSDATNFGSTFTYLAECITKARSKKEILDNFDHSLLEFYKKNVSTINAYLSVAISADMIPTGSEWLAEPKFTLEMGGLPFTANFDLLNVVDFCIFDYKVRKNMKYAPDTESILNDPQLNLYGAILTRVYDLPADQMITIGQNNIIKEGLYPVKVKNKKRAGDFLEFFEENILPRAESLIFVLDTESQEQLKPNFDQCNKYLGCSYAAICKHNIARNMSNGKNVSRRTDLF